MNASLALQNLTAYSLQLLLIVAVGATLPALFRLRSPRARLWYWQALLLCCLALPALESRRTATSVQSGEVTVTTSGMMAATGRTPGTTVPPAVWILWGLAGGCAARLGWLGLGLIRLRRHRARAVPLDVTPLLREVSSSVGAWPDIYISDDVPGPVTFGAISPVVVFPRRFLLLEESAQRGIACHEFLHVRRRDWLFTITEELLRCALWFHPAVWWILSRIQLAREQAVDHAVVECVQDRALYLETLLDAAAVRAGLDPALAPLFLRKHHLSQRVQSLLKEPPMSTRRLISSLIPISAVAFLAARLSVALFPLAAPAQDLESSPGVAVDLGAYKLVHGSGVVYPPSAREQKIEGVVQLETSVDEQGAVTDAQVIAGPAELRKAALEAALTWHFAGAGTLPPKIPVTIRFQLSGVPAPPPQVPLMNGQPTVLKHIVFGPMPPNVAETLARDMPVHVGDTLTQEVLSNVLALVSRTDEHLNVNVHTDAGAVTLVITLPGAPSGASNVAGQVRQIRVGSRAQAANLIHEVAPQYPPLAKQARIQGTVRFNVVIGKDGKVNNIQLLSGHPLLAPAAAEALRQWVYRPTLLNGDPIEVKSQVDVNFTLPNGQ